MVPSFMTLDSVCADPTTNKESIKIYKDISVRLPDLAIYKSEEGECYPYSRAINTIADELDVCEGRDMDKSDISVWAWPSTVIENTIIYTNPPYFWLGDSNLNGFGIEPNPEIEALMDKDELSFKAKRQIRAWLKGHPAISYL
jgi:hypothetical protein